MTYISEIQKTALEKGHNETQDRAFALLEELNIPFECVENEVVETMEECKELDEALGTEIRKSLLIRNQKKTRYYLVVMPAAKRCNMGDLSWKLGEGKLSFASEQAMMDLLGAHPGSASIMGIINDTEDAVQVVFDQSVTKEEWFGCNTGINTAHLKLKTEDVLKKILPALHHKPMIVSL